MLRKEACYAILLKLPVFVFYGPCPITPITINRYVRYEFLRTVKIICFVLLNKRHLLLYDELPRLYLIVSLPYLGNSFSINSISASSFTLISIYFSLTLFELRKALSACFLRLYVFFLFSSSKFN